MSRHLNKVQLIGLLGADPEMRFTQDGRAIASLRVATSDSWTDKQGQKQERTEWHSVSVFGKLAEIAQQYLRKGSKVYLEGQLQTDKYTDKQGIERYATKVVLSSFSSQMIMLDRPGGGGGAPAAGAGYGETPAYAGPPNAGYAGAPAYSKPAPQSAPPPAAEHFDQTPEFDDDIPF
ncbi:MAG: single-stranded DNA-binding protein [Magnetococcales bacterium]|nr:single-stranded DNA-binding protein [Magnetococcales bacterium]